MGILSDKKVSESLGSTMWFTLSGALVLAAGSMGVVCGMADDMTDGNYMEITCTFYLT